MPLLPGRTLCLVGMLAPGPAVLGLPSQPAMPHCMPFVVVAGRNEGVSCCDAAALDQGHIHLSVQG